METICFKPPDATKQKQPKIPTVTDGIVGAIAVLFFGFILIVSIGYGGSDDYKFSKMYYSGEYECIEGKVTDFYKEGTKPNDIGVESFMVNDVLFEYRDALRWAFQNFPRVITRNGQEVRIYYIHYRLGDVGDDWRNVIVRVDIKK